MRSLTCIGILLLGLMSACGEQASHRKGSEHQDMVVANSISVNHLAHDVARCWAGAKAAVANQDNYARQDCATARNRSVSVFGRKDTAVFRLTDEISDAVYALDLQRVDPEAVSAEDRAFRKEARNYSMERIGGAPIEEAIAEIVRAGVAGGADPRYYEAHMRKLILSQ